MTLDRSVTHRLLALGVLSVAVAVGLAALRGGGSPTSRQLGPTVAAEARDLITTLDASGILQRSGEVVVAYASPISSAGSASSGGGGGSGGSGRASAAAYRGATPSSTDTTSDASSTSTSSSSTSTSSPCPPATSTSTSTTSPCSTTPTTTPTPTTIPSTSPSTSSTPPSTSPSGGTGEPPSGEIGSPGDGSAELSGRPGAGEPSPAEASGGEPGSGPGEGGGQAPSATLTSVTEVGTTADRGTVLYTADQQPVVALIGDVPAWRTLRQGVAAGADVRQLEDNLVALGYGPGVVDESFTADTAAAVRAWETDLGRTAPDGEVRLGDVVFLAAPGDVLGHEAVVGDALDVGTPVLTVGSEQRVVVANVDTIDAGGWTPGATVEVEWADTSSTEGTVLGIGREVTDGQVELIVAIGAGHAGAGERRSGAAATVTLAAARRNGAIAVPVAAVVHDAGSPAVRVTQPDGPDRLVPVETGLVADGWVEITSGLEGGEEVRLPG